MALTLVPKSGGVLTMLGSSDVDHMDPNASYTPVGYLSLRMWSRGLYAYPAVAGQTTSLMPDLATATPTLSDGGLKESVTIRTGAMWNTVPTRQVTAADVVRAVKRSCNPTLPFAGRADFQNLIVGYQAYCQAFANVSSTDETAQVQYMDSHNIGGVSVDPSNPLTVVFTLVRPTAYFAHVLVAPAFSPVPEEYLQYLPGSAAAEAHTYSDGPYQVKTYAPDKSIDFVRNPAWNMASDPLRKAYVDEIKVTETDSAAAIEQKIQTNTPQADMEWDTHVPPASVPGLIATKNPDFSLNPSFSSDPYIVFNAISKNNGGALETVPVRQALEYAISRQQLIKDAGGSTVAPALKRILPPGIGGSQPYTNPYPHSFSKAKQLLAAAGHKRLTLTLLYSSSPEHQAMFQTIQANLGKVGVTVKGLAVSNSDLYAKYLQPGTPAKNSVWDMALATRAPDWYSDSAASFFLGMFDSRSLPPDSANWGFFSDTIANNLLDQALAATSDSSANAIWHQADVQVMNDAAIFPITDPNVPVIHGSRVQNAVYVPALGQFDPTNVWLS
jgi:peptide/nickel transport system substrate-binding protein